MKKSTKHMQFLRISLLIFAISFIFACSLGTQRYGKLSLSIEVPEYIKTEPNEQANNARFIHPNGDSLEFELYTERRVIHTQTIPLNPKSNSPQTVPISVDKVPYNVSLFAKITVYGNLAPVAGNSILGQNTIDIGKLRYPTQKLTLGVKPVSDTTVVYKGYQAAQGEDPYIYLESSGTYADTFNIEMFPKKGLYTVYGYNYNIYLYDSDGKNYPNSFLINGNDGQKTRVFYHPENSPSTYYAYLSEETDSLSGDKLAQDILITKKMEYPPTGEYSIEILNDGHGEDLETVSSAEQKNSLVLTIYNPYPFTLNLKLEIENADVENVNPDSTDKFTFTDFPDVLLPGKSKEFTVNFQDNPYNAGATYNVKSTISAPGAGLSDFVLHFTGSTSA